MKRKLSIVYAWLVRSLLFFLPDTPTAMRIRGFLYSLMMRNCGSNFQVAHSAILNSITELNVGNDVYVANNALLLCGGTVTIADNVLIGPGVVISSNNHGFNENTGFRFASIILGPVVINQGAWLCANSVVAKDSIIPEFAVLSPCSVYTSKLNNLIFETRVGKKIFSGNPASLISSHNEIKK